MTIYGDDENEGGDMGFGITLTTAPDKGTRDQLNRIERTVVNNAQTLQTIQKGLDTLMADVATDSARLEADVQAQTAAIAQVGQIVTADAASIKTLQDEVAALKASATPPDTTALEAALASLEANNAALQAIAPASPASAPAAPADGTVTAPNAGA